MDAFLQQATQYITQKTTAAVQFADLEDRLTDTEIVALEAAASPEFLAFHAEMKGLAAASIAAHPMGVAITQAIDAALQQRLPDTGRTARERAARLFAGDPHRLARFAAVTDGLRLAQVFGDQLPILRVTELAVPWRTALGDTYDIGRLGIIVKMDSAHWRPEGAACPIDAAQITSAKCAEDCDYFRGTSSGVAEHPEWAGLLKMNCNWPRSGAKIAAPRPSIATREHRLPPPTWLVAAFSTDETPPEVSA